MAADSDTRGGEVTRAPLRQRKLLVVSESLGCVNADLVLHVQAGLAGDGGWRLTSPPSRTSSRAPNRSNTSHAKKVWAA